MFRTTVPSAVRKTSAVAGAAALLVLAGCAGDAGAEEPADETAAEASAESSADGGSTASGEYEDGTYTADGSYQTPETVEKVTVTLTLADGVVSDVEVTGDPQAPETEKFQGQFIDGIGDEVVGKSLDDIKVDRVAGSSLTSGGFNQALESIKEQAAA